MNQREWAAVPIPHHVTPTYLYWVAHSSYPAPQNLKDSILCLEASIFEVPLQFNSAALPNNKLLSPCIFYTSPTMVSNNCEVNEIGEEAMSILDLPELTLECILGKLPPVGLSSMAGVCRSLRERCRSDHLWERHMREKWGRVVVGSAAAQDKWRRYLASRQDCGGERPRVWVESLICFWPFSWVKSRLFGGGMVGRRMLDDSIMSRFVELERGGFWFPAQVYNRENGHVGFMLSCYDAELRYDRHTNTFQARYPPHGRRTTVTELGLNWDRLRAPPVITSAQDLHLSDCLTDLRPGDHIEIQWRRNKEFPYGWWYGMVGHLESCDGNEHFCRCSTNDTITLEFNQYTPGSRWRRASISRKDHREEGNETDGFYGGLRKLYNKDEILTWKQLSQSEISV